MAGNKNSGRKPKTQLNEEAKLQLHEGLAASVKYIVRVAKGKEKADFARLAACEYDINQCIGKPTQRIEAEGSVSPGLEELLRELAAIHKGEPDGTQR